MQSRTLLYTEKSLQESCAVAKMTARCALYMGAMNFRDSLTTPTATMNVPTKFEGPSFTRS